MKQGFALLEMLVYMAILSFMLANLFTSVLYLHDSVARSSRVANNLLHTLNVRDQADTGIHEI